MMILRANTAKELMNPGPYSIAADSTVAAASHFLTSRGFGAAVVIDEAGHPIGVVTKTDLLIHEREKAPGTPEATVKEVMTPAVFSVREDTPAHSVVEQLLVLNVHHLFVADKDGTIVGVISPVDVLRRLEH
jgi:predicted transcriptional regulator